ncbi:HPr kinase [Planctomycetales bacterium]|nr:HPr kinase [Planctomycetales bacterium]GHT06272.1 HPr kinase [Planctomycetales bacterium]GHV23672.1 HPr kinase [Planctomycetales bacterium]
MPKISVVVKLANQCGLHARAAMLFAQICEKFTSAVALECDGATADGKNILEIMSLAIPPDKEFLLAVAGDDAEPLLAALQQLIADKFGEAE